MCVIFADVLLGASFLAGIDDAQRDAYGPGKEAYGEKEEVCAPKVSKVFLFLVARVLHVFSFFLFL